MLRKGTVIPRVCFHCACINSAIALFEVLVLKIYSTCDTGNALHSKVPSLFFVTGKPASPSNFLACSGSKPSPLGCGYPGNIPSGVNADRGFVIRRDFE